MAKKKQLVIKLKVGKHYHPSINGEYIIFTDLVKKFIEKLTKGNGILLVSNTPFNKNKAVVVRVGPDSEPSFTLYRRGKVDLDMCDKRLKGLFGEIPETIYVKK